MPTLADLQREFAGAVTALEGAPPGAAALEARLRADRDVPASRRIAVYANAYFARLHDALRADYPTLAEALGEDAFHDLAKLYLIAHPPRSFTLRVLGRELPAFLRSPAAEFFRARWPLAPDLAALEWAIADVFDAPDAPVLARETLARLAPDAWAGMRFELVAAQRRVSLGWTEILVHRRHELVHHRALAPDEAAALAALAAGEDFATLCACVGSASRMLELLERWLADELLSALRT
jgi:hypothetical protein